MCISKLKRFRKGGELSWFSPQKINVNKLNSCGFNSYIKNCLLDSFKVLPLLCSPAEAPVPHGFQPVAARPLTAEHEARTSLCGEQNKYGFGILIELCNIFRK